ncbi:hypothetical protein FB446DRAFT_845028 [Lentinula raphanica]|nr:hypothetical protein FB446DRAFT_845028 [Lentinula raphanica]
MSYNYAQAYGWDSVAAAAVFAALYAPLDVYFVWKMVQERRRVVFTMMLFCTIRIAAYILRAIAAGIPGAGENENVFIAAEVLFSVGFFGLLYATYSLVMDRLDLLPSLPTLPIPLLSRLLALTRNRRLFRLALTVPMALGIAGINESTENPNSSTGNSLRKASAIVFLVMTALQVGQTLVLVKAEYEGKDPLTNPLSSLSKFGSTHAPLILTTISLLLLIREIFTVATIDQFSKATNEHYWYPLVALPEILCVVLYTVPGMIPPRNVGRVVGEEMKMNGGAGEEEMRVGGDRDVERGYAVVGLIVIPCSSIQ